MNVLISNDDGVFSRGLSELAKKLIEDNVDVIIETNDLEVEHEKM